MEEEEPNSKTFNFTPASALFLNSDLLAICQCCVDGTRI